MSEDPKPYVNNPSNILQQKATLFVQRHRDHIDAKIRNQLQRNYDRYKDWTVEDLYARAETLRTIGHKTAQELRAYIDTLLQRSKAHTRSTLNIVSIDRIKLRLLFELNGETYFGQGHIFGNKSSDPFDRVAARAGGVQVDFVYNIESIDQYREREGEGIDYRDLGVPDEAIEHFKNYLSENKQLLELWTG